MTKLALWNIHIKWPYLCNDILVLVYFIGVYQTAVTHIIVWNTASWLFCLQSFYRAMLAQSAVMRE